MKVAVFLKNNELTVLHETKVHVVIFNIENGKVIGVENNSLEKQSHDAIISWLYHKSISQIYLLEINDYYHRKMKLKGIKTRTIEMLKYDKLYNSFAILPSIPIVA